MSVNQIITLMALYRRMAEARGNRLLVIIDYLQKINWREFHRTDERIGVSLVSNILRDTVEVQNSKSPLHYILFSQENGEGNAFGSSAPLFVSQLHLAMQRTSREECEAAGKPMKDWPIEGQKDALGNQLYWHRAVDRWHSVAAITVKKGNDNPGGTVKVVFENAMYNISDYVEHGQKADKVQ